MMADEVESDAATAGEDVAVADEAIVNANKAIMDDSVVGRDDGERPRQMPGTGGSELAGLSPDALLEQGIALSLEQLDGSGLTHLEVFSAFRPVLVFHRKGRA